MRFTRFVVVDVLSADRPVINTGALKSKDYATVLDDICRVVQASRAYPVKVILENSPRR